MSSDKLKAMKLFPRNMTAHADTIVRGNPITSRPETGVENSWPGLEFDHRNLEKVFFRGLYFEYHDERGTILRDFHRGSPAAKFFKRSDIEEGIYLAYLQGDVVSGWKKSKRETRVFSFIPPASLENWRIVRDLEKGPVAVALCKKKIYDMVVSNQLGLAQVKPLFKKRKDRREQGFVLLFGERSEYLTAEGVIDPTLIPPGDLTRSMCSPWQYDFTDCGCFFWASNKPDMVASADQPQQILNWRRRNRSHDAERTASDWLLKDGGNWEDANTLNHVDLIHHFQDQKFVFGGREADEYVPPVPLSAKGLLDRAEVIRRLKILATVEHALTVEYLYAYYSFKLPPGTGPQREPWKIGGRPSDETSEEARIFTAANEVLTIAIDEMRHLRLANEILSELGQGPVLDRAKIIGQNFPEHKGFNQPFELLPLTAEQLDWFIKVEKASANHKDPSTIDGMYTLILRSVEEGPGFAGNPDERDRIGHRVKIIIDEGLDHYRRFSHAKEALAGIPEARYLNVRTGPKPALDGSPEKLLQDTADASYLVLLRALDYVFRQGKQQHGALLEAARRAMYNIDDANRSLSEKRLGALFTLPDVTAKAAVAAVATPHDIGEPLRAHIARLRGSGDSKMIALGERMEAKLADLTEGIEAAGKQQ
ncbi:MAG TPA: ferritin-like domain-containing protein [Thermoanaerobaculia bacterium]|nr:ferritin-like domain-containing protein [Thermoanaerobaculia bacterium]